MKIHILKKIAGLIKKVIDKIYFKLFNYSRNKIDPVNEDKYYNYLVRLAECKTLISADRLYIIYQCLRNIQKLKGDCAELGVYKGGSAKIISHFLMKYSPQKNLYLLDTFEGMPETDKKIDRHKEGDFKDTNLNEVKEFLSNSNNIIFLKGLFADTLPKITRKDFSFVHIDADVYSSVKEGIEFFYPRLINGGIMLFDDYGFLSCPGAKKAVDEFFENNIEAPMYLFTGQCLVHKIK